MASTTKKAVRMAGPRPIRSAVSLPLVIIRLPFPELRQGPDARAPKRPAPAGARSHRDRAPPNRLLCQVGRRSAPVPRGLALVDGLAGEPIPAPVVARVVAVRRPVGVIARII